MPDLNQPLRTGLQEELGVTALAAHCPSQAIVDVSENMRAKLYSLFCKLGEQSEADNSWAVGTFTETLLLIGLFAQFNMS